MLFRGIALVLSRLSGVLCLLLPELPVSITLSILCCNAALSWLVSTRFTTVASSCGGDMLNSTFGGNFTGSGGMNAMCWLRAAACVAMAMGELAAACAAPDNSDCEACRSAAVDLQTSRKSRTCCSSSLKTIMQMTTLAYLYTVHLHSGSTNLHRINDHHGIKIVSFLSTTKKSTDFQATEDDCTVDACSSIWFCSVEISPRRSLSVACKKLRGLGQKQDQKRSYHPAVHVIVHLKLTPS